MIQLFTRLFALGLAACLAGCFIIERNLGPMAEPQHAWIKTGFDPVMVESELWNCTQTTGFNPKTVREDTLRPKYDMCMLHKGFRYIDSPRPLSQQGFCSVWGDDIPSCQYLRGTLKVVPNNPVTPEQAAIRMVEDSPRPNGVPAFTVKCLYSLTCYNALERAEPGRVQKVIDALPDDVRTLLLNGRYWTPAAKNNRSPLFPKEK